MDVFGIKGFKPSNNGSRLVTTTRYTHGARNMRWKAHLSFAVLFASVTHHNLSLAQDAPTPTPVFQPAAGAIISGLSGLVTGAQQALGSDRTISRTMMFRLQLTNRLLSAPAGTTKINVGALNSDNTDYLLSDRTILCSVRGRHAVIAADAAYISSVAGTLDKFATPPKIAGLGDAL